MSNQTPISPGKNFVAGGFGGMCLVIAGHPFDTIKVRLQAMPVPKNGLAPMYTSAFDCVRKTFVNEGLRGFYKGMATPTIIRKLVKKGRDITEYRFVSFRIGCSSDNFNKLMDPMYWPSNSRIREFDLDGGPSAMVRFNKAAKPSGWSNVAEEAKNLEQTGTAAMDTSQVRLQAMPVPKNGLAPMYTSAFDCVRKTFVNEGLRGFYKGMATPTIMVTPNFALAFFGYGLGKAGISKFFPGEMTPIKMFFAGGFSGAMCTFIICPVERIKCLLQIQADKAPMPGQVVYAGPIDCGRQLLKTGGISSLYRGLGATFIRGVPQAGLYFMTYEIFKKAFTPADGSTLTPIRTLTAGGMTGIINWIFMLPADVIKSRIQTAPEGTYPNGFRDALLALLRQDGAKGLYRGIVPVFVRAFPANAACFMGFEVAIKVLNWTAPNL